MALEIVDAGSRGTGVYVGGYNIAPNVVLIWHADSYSDAWDALCEHLANEGRLVPCDDPDCEDGETCSWVDGHGIMVTADLVMDVVRPGRFD